MAEPEEVPEMTGVEGAHDAEGEMAPGPSFWPLVLALGFAMSMIGVITKLPVLIIGLVVTVVALGGWIRDARRDYVALHR